LPVIESYKLLGAIYDIKPDVLDARIKEIADFFGIHELLGKKANNLSLGQRMICEVAAATLHRPDVIFFDEPTIGLDLAV
jgi:ABC-2 type transport system ATP-binding protein